MQFRLDHVVIAVHDLARAVEDYRALGFTVQMGGRHPGRTSHNALVVFEDGAYLELIAWPEPGPAERWYNVLTAHGEGFMDFALIPEDVPRAIEAARARGLPMHGPVDGSRVRPDGRELRWQTGRQTTFDLPFFCGDVTPRELRVPEGSVRQHGNGALGVASLTVGVHDVDVSRARYRALLGSPELTVGETRLVLRPRIAAREGTCAMQIRTSMPAKAGLLDPALAHGAAMELTPPQDAPTE
jgi:catechol 2,3-dioxygenase-like lactoylglutathione lyase family enzyme